MSTRAVIFALAAILSGCAAPTMPESPEDAMRSMTVTTHTVVDGNPRFAEPVAGRCADGMVPVRVAAWNEMVGQQVGDWYWVTRCRQRAL